MDLPPYYLARPQIELTPAGRDEFEELSTRFLSEDLGDSIEYSYSAPKWQFLCYLGDSRDLVFHGSGDPEITEFEPRQSDDSGDFGNQKAVYASSDALWAMYFAVVDRPRHVQSLVNACIHVIGPGGERTPYYYFSVNADALPHRPWRTGTVYVLPRDGFEQQESHRPDIELTHWRSFAPVKPLAKVSISPDDFPFLDRVRGHDFEVVRRRALEDPDGFPWLDE